MTKYGYFDDQKKEYVITNCKTPVKWVNYVGTLNFGGIVDHTGGALICKQDPALNRISKYIPQLPDADFKGQTIFIRFKENNKYHIYSPFYVPTLKELDKYECHVGLGYQHFISEYKGIKTEITMFVPLDADIFIQDIKVTNTSGKNLEIDVIPVLEFTHFDALKQYTNADWVPQTMIVDAIKEVNDLITLKQYAFMKKETSVNYITSNHAIDSFQTDRRLFLGNNGYNSWANPQELQNDSLSNYEARRGYNIAALLHKLGTVKPNQTKRIITELGQVETLDKSAMKTINTYRQEKNVDKAFQKIADFWQNYLDKQQIETPDPSFDSMINIHNPRQCHTTLNWSRYLSLYQLGLGARGIGFRDSSQDSMGVLSSVPEQSKELLIKLLSMLKEDGSAMHQFFPLTMEGNEGDSREDGAHKYYGDDHNWIILAVCAYLKETGDIGFLNQKTTYYDKELHSDKRKKGTVLEHLQKALAFTKKNIGQHGLPLLGFADWNDTVNLKGNAESLFVANLYGKGLLEMIELMDFLGENQAKEQYIKDHEAMKKIVNETAWDGEWYIRYYEDDGTPIGSKNNTEGKIYTNGQSWSIISEFAEKQRAKTALKSVKKLLNTERGIKLSTPGYNGFDWKKGGVTTYPPGAKENGGIFLHSNPWVIIAETMVGNGNQAYQYYKQINPASKNDDLDTFECEPYSYPQNILGDEHPQFGLARNSWLSGTSSWTYQAATKYILGIMPRFTGLEINPCIPKEWDKFKVTRVFRGTTYDIKVTNPKKINKGVKTVTVDGKKIDDNIVPVFLDNKVHTVLVEMG